MIEIRRATSEDLPALISLYEQLEDMGKVWSGAKFSPIDIRLSREVFTQLAHYQDYEIYIAQAGDKIGGTLGLLVMASVPNGIPSAIVENLLVDRTFRRNGVGRKLMQFAIDRCRSLGCYELTLSS